MGVGSMRDQFGALRTLQTGYEPVEYFALEALASQPGVNLRRMPITVKILLENMLRLAALGSAHPDDVRTLARWAPGARLQGEFPFLPARVLLQDFTGVPAVVDLAAMRAAMADLGGDPNRINPLAPADLVIDHSVQVDMFGTTLAFTRNVELEYERNRERYALLRWAQQAFDQFSVVPPGTGICHQVNLEYLSRVVQTRQLDGHTVAMPDTLVGTDSHTPMVNGLGVLGWGVGGIEAEAALLGQPMYLLLPTVVGFRFHGRLPDGATATDLVLTVTEMLRRHGVVGKFVEYSGPGLSQLSVADRATLSNMSPEYGATAGLFPVDNATLDYLRMTNRPPELIDLVERYTRAQGLFRTDEGPEPDFSETLELDLSTVEPSLAGPRRPQDRVALPGVPQNFRSAFPEPEESGGGTAVATRRRVELTLNGVQTAIRDGSVAIAAITSCTNTSNPSVMVAAGLLAKHAVERGLTVNPAVKTSLAPGSRVVTDYLEGAGLLPYLEALRFHVVGYGCTTCIAAGTPVLLANGTARPIEDMPSAGGAIVFGPTSGGALGVAAQTEAMDQGRRECVSVVLQDGRTLTCTPDHELLCADGRWVRADELVPGRDRVVMGLEAPLDVPGDDEIGYVLQAGELTFTMATPQERLRTLAFARLLAHLLGDGSISAAGQGRMNVGQAVDRRVVLDDIELLTGLRPAATRYDERKWAIVLPVRLTNAIRALSGVRVGRRIEQPPCLPDFVLSERCPTAVVREFLGGLFGADGQAPTLHRWGASEERSTLEPPQFAQSARPEQREALRHVMTDILRLLGRCGVNTTGAALYDYPTRRAASSYPAAGDGIPRIEVRLVLADGLSFVEHVGFRYCIDKQMRASAAAVYWRTVKMIHEQRLWMSARLEELHETQPALPFSRARRVAAEELSRSQAVIYPHYALLEGHDRFSRLPQVTARAFQPLHRESCDFPSPVAMFKQMGVRGWFAPLLPRAESDGSKRYGAEKDALTVPTFSLQVADRQPAGMHHVFDLAVDDLHAFVAGTFAVHNCIGNSGPLLPEISEAVRENDLVVCSVLSGNRNFEGRIHPEVRASYLASPPLVVAYALAGSIDKDLTREPLATDPDGNPVYLWELWPSPEEIAETVNRAVKPELFADRYGHVFSGDEHWKTLPVPEGDQYEWDPNSTYVREPDFFQGLAPEPGPVGDITGARVLARLGDSITTDHISPAGSIPPTSPAGQYLIDHGVERRDFNSYGARRGNHEVMIRGTFGNIRLRNEMTPGKEGDWTAFQPGGEVMRIFDASERYRQQGTPLLVIAGKEYGSGSSRDWAAKGPMLLGIKAIIAESYERIHRSNLVAMGVLPLQFQNGQTRYSLNLDGTETYDITGLSDDLKPGQTVTVRVTREDGSAFDFPATVRIDSGIEVEYYRHGGVLQMVLRRLLHEGG